MGGQAEESSYHPGLGLALFAFSAAVTTPAALGKPADLPKQGPVAFDEAFPEQAEDTTVTCMLTPLDTAGNKNTTSDSPDSPSLTAFLEALPNLSQYVVEGGCPKEQPEAGLGENKETSGEPLKDSDVESSWKSPLRGLQDGPLLSPLRIPLLSPLASPPAAPQPHPPCMAQLVAEPLHRQPRQALARLPQPPSIVSRQPVPRLGEAGGKQAKHPVPASIPRTQETCPRDIPQKAKTQTVAEPWKTLWDGKLNRGGVAAGGSGQQAGSSKRRAPDTTSVPAKRPSPCPGWGLRAKPTPLEEQEESVPITPKQRPEREHMKKLAQRERERAALQMSLGQMQFFVQREIDMEIVDKYGRP